MTKKESEISKEIRTYLDLAGYAVYSTEQGYRKERGGTRMTPGIPDLIVIGHGCCLFVEVKRPGGKLRPAQETFRDHLLEVMGIHPPGSKWVLDWQLWTDVTQAEAWHNGTQ